MIDRTPRYAPTRILCGNAICPVREYIAHPPGDRPDGCPIAPEFTALEMRTERGSRWYGFERVWINSELRMVVSGFGSADIIRARWEECKTR